MSDSASQAASIDARIARRLDNLRAERGYSLEALAGRSGVSRSMISKIERGEVSATAATLSRLATGLGVPLPDLLGFAVRGPARPHDVVARRNGQEHFTDPESGYQRRTLTPPGFSLDPQLYECRLPPGAHVSFENFPASQPVRQQLWVLKGELHVLAGETARRLAAGDCMAMTPGPPHALHNVGTTLAHYLVAASKCP